MSSTDFKKLSKEMSGSIVFGSILLFTVLILIAVTIFGQVKLS